MAVDDDRRLEARAILEGMGHIVTSESRVNDAGWSLRTKAGPIVNLWDNGNCTVQGKSSHPGMTQEDVRAATVHLGKGYSGPARVRSRKVFVVYGHDVSAREQLEMILHRWELEPIFLDQMPSAGQTIIEKLELHQGEASFAVVLATPDDEGYLRGQEANKRFRARQNVVLELGMLLNRLGRANVVILYKGPMELPSDIAGLLYIPFKEHINDAKSDLYKEFVNAGIAINPARL